ncbi:Uncharacterised protein [uncultured archaeon]|nr:Uncharacterised protein [uncultured archaeon]
MTFNAPGSPGTYDLRMFDTDDGGREIASITFTVLEAAGDNGESPEGCFKNGMQYCMVCEKPPCLYCPSHFGDIAPSQSELIFEVMSPGGTLNNPPRVSSFTLDSERTISGIATYHWPGVTPGTIGLRSTAGDLFGPWQAEGRPGMGGVPDAIWIAYFNQRLPAGTYTIVDSSQSTWSYVPGDCSDERGLCQVFAYR